MMICTLSPREFLSQPLKNQQYLPSSNSRLIPEERAGGARVCKSLEAWEC